MDIVITTLVAGIGGALLIAGNGQMTAGCVALRKFKDGICEMKRLFVRPQFRGQGIGRALAENIIKEGTRLGYKLMCLGALDRLQEAMRLSARKTRLSQNAASRQRNEKKED